MQKRQVRNQQIGRYGEDAVALYLANRGAEVIDRNWRIKEGEIDIIGRTQGGLFLFIEVKTRSSLAFGHPLESITPQKAGRLQRLALAWLATHRALGAEYRIDCAAVLLHINSEPQIDYRAGVL